MNKVQAVERGLSAYDARIQETCLAFPNPMTKFDTQQCEQGERGGQGGTKDGVRTLTNLSGIEFAEDD